MPIGSTYGDWNFCKSERRRCHLIASIDALFSNDTDAADVSFRCKPISAHKSEKHHAKEREHVAYWSRTKKIDANILTHLTDADLRYLVDAEDELALRGDFELIYPAKETIEHYLSLLEVTYADLLLSAWICLSPRERLLGVERLKMLAKDAHHLSAVGAKAKNAD